MKIFHPLQQPDSEAASEVLNQGRRNRTATVSVRPNLMLAVDANRWSEVATPAAGDLTWGANDR